MFTTSDPLNRSVTLKYETWNYKIANTNGENSDRVHGNSHEDMTPLLQEIKTTVEKPNFIIKDTQIIGMDENGNEIVNFFCLLFSIVCIIMRNNAGIDKQIIKPIGVCKNIAKLPSLAILNWYNPSI